jgi:transcription elongation factor Elf1
MSVVLWSCYHRRHRTKNAVEGWNDKVNSYFERPRPNSTKVSGCLQKEEENCNHLHVRFVLNLEGKNERSAILT